MKLFNYGAHRFVYYSFDHISMLLLSIICGAMLILIPYFLINKRKYAIFLGYFVIFTKIFDMLYRTYVENEPFLDTLPLNLCNVSLLIGGLYLITNKDIYFNILYFWFPGSILALMLPGFDSYHTLFYVFIFMFTHVLEISIVIYGFLHNSPKITKKGLMDTIFLYFVLIFVAYAVNSVLHTNYMYIQYYIIKSVSFIKPLIVYRIIFVSLMILSMLVMYLPFLNVFDDKEIEEEYII